MVHPCARPSITMRSRKVSKGTRKKNAKKGADNANFSLGRQPIDFRRCSPAVEFAGFPRRIHGCHLASTKRVTSLLLRSLLRFCYVDCCDKKIADYSATLEADRTMLTGFKKQPLSVQRSEVAAAVDGPSTEARERAVGSNRGRVRRILRRLRQKCGFSRGFWG